MENPGWLSNRKRVVFYNGDRYFLLYSRLNSSIFYKSSTDNVTWSGETLLLSGASDVFDIYLVNDTKFDLVYHIHTASTRNVRTCTISGGTITVGNPSVAITEDPTSLAVVRSGAGRIYLIGRNASGDLWVAAANNIGDAEGVTAWPRQVDDNKAATTAVAIVPYQDADQVLVVYTKNPGGSNNDGVYSRVVTSGSGGTEVQCGDFNNLPDFSSPIRISDTDFRIAIKIPSGNLEEYKWNGVDTWSFVETIDTVSTRKDPSLFYDRISGDMYVFSVWNNVERHRKPSGGSWVAGGDFDGETGVAFYSYPITQMHEPPYGSSRTCSELVWAFRVESGTEYNLKVGSEPLTPCNGGEGSFGFRKSITIDRTKIPGTCGSTLPDFPMLFSVTDGDLKTTAYGGDVASYDAPTNDPRDIIFRALDDDTCGGPGTAPCGLYHEIENYVESTGELVAWVKIPSVNTNAASSDTVIYVYYGNSDITSPSELPTGVWDTSFREVFHLHEDSGTLYDSTANGYTGAAGGSATQGVAGKISKAVGFDGTAGSRVTLSDGSMASNQTFTFSAWVRADTLQNEWEGIVTKGRESGVDWQGLWINGSNLLTFGWELPDGNVDGSTLSPGQWYYVAATYDGTNRRLYLNDVLDGGPIAGSHSTDIGENTLIGEDLMGSVLEGVVDEVRISNVPRNACWIAAEYNNQVWPDKAVTPTPDPSPNPDSGFYTVGGEEPNPPTAVSLLSFAARGQGSSVLVEWETAQEIKNAGFNLQRAESPFGPFTKLNGKLIPGLTYSVKGKSYSFVDSSVTRGKLYYYRLEDIDVYGKKRLHGPICVDWDADGLPDDWEIAYGFNPLLNDAYTDLDRDGLTNLEEYEHETDPFNPDSDGDGIPDGQESGKVDRGETVETRTLTKGVQIVASDDTGVTLELRTDNYEMEKVQADEDVFQRLRVSDYIHGFTSEVGKPELPMKGLLLDLPDGVSATLRVEATESQTLSGYWIYPVPEKAVSGEEGSEHVAEFFAMDETAYSSDVFYPGVVADLGETYLFRDQQKLQVRFYPFAFNPKTRELKYYTRIRVRVEYGVASANTRSASRALALPVASNPSASPRALGWTPPSPNPIYKISVSEEGIYRMTGTWLAANGVSLTSMSLDQIRLYNLGQEVPIHVYDGSVAGQFDSGDYIEFYGEPVVGQYKKYARNNVYWLTDSGVSGGLRMGTIDGSFSGTQVPPSVHTSTVRYEEDKQYDGTVPGADHLDRWFFDRFVTGADWPAIHPWYGGVGTDFDLHLPEVAGLGSLTITLFAPFDMDHEVEVSVNSTVRTLTWDGIGYHEASVNSVNLVEGLNTVTLRCNMASDGIMVDRFEVTYPRTFVANGDTLKFSYDAGSAYQILGFSGSELLAFDITIATEVRQIINLQTTDMGGSYSLDMEPRYGTGERTYLVLSTNELKLPVEITQVVDPDLSNGANGANYILITHRDLGWDGNGDAYSWLSALVALRQTQGLRVKVVDVEDIYNEFSYGITTPQAIKDFLTHAYNNWVSPAPQYVLLVGDSTYDYKDNLNLGTINYVPTYLSWTDYMGETLTDDWFARVSGSDAIPDLYIGRLPAATLAQADAMVNKILTYESTTNTKTWEKNTLLVADDQTEYYKALFETMSNDVAALIPTGMNTPFKGYLADYIDPADLTATIKEKINNDGTLMVNYSGHGSVQIWTPDPIFDVGDVADLSNSNKLPFFVSMTCLTGFFGYPEAWDYPSLAEVLVRSANKGAVAAFMSTGMTQPQGQRILDTSLFEAIFKQDLRALGPAISAAKQTLLANGQVFEDVSKTFLLFGDPATKLKVPLPTVPTRFVAEVQGSNVVLSWQGATDANGGAVVGYNVYRSTTPGGPYTTVNTALIAGTGFTDTSAQTGTFYYVVKSVDSDGDESVPSNELAVLAGTRTLSTTLGGGAGGGGGGCFISLIAGS